MVQSSAAVPGKVAAAHLGRTCRAMLHCYMPCTQQSSPGLLAETAGLNPLVAAAAPAAAPATPATAAAPADCVLLLAALGAEVLLLSATFGDATLRSREHDKAAEKNTQLVLHGLAATCTFGDTIHSLQL